MEIIYEINRRFLEEVSNRFPGDNERLARLMWPVTGRVIAGYNWHQGSFEYLPVPAEVDQHERRFMNLGHREVLLWDKLGGDETDSLVESIRGVIRRARDSLIGTSRDCGRP